MRIALDLHACSDLMQGSHTYIYNLARHLLEVDAETEYYLYFSPGALALENPVFQRANARRRVIHPAGRAGRLTVGFPLELLRSGVDVFHCQYVAPPLCPCPYVVTIHDIIHERRPEFYPPRLRRMMQWLYPPSARRAARVLTVSAYTKREVHELYHVHEDRIVVSPNAASDEFRLIADRSEVEAVLARYGVRPPYALFVGRIEPRKNIGALLRSYAEMRSSGGPACPLVLVGMKDPLFAAYDAEMRACVRGEDVRFLGGVPQEHLPHFYNGAEVLVYPSFAEGFGLPVLEAAACGTPVITSNATALPEVMGTAACLIDPRDEHGLAEALRAVLTDGPRRARMRQAGLEQAARFSWRRTAEQVLQVYREVAATRRRT